MMADILRTTFFKHICMNLKKMKFVPRDPIRDKSTLGDAMAKFIPHYITDVVTYLSWY